MYRRSTILTEAALRPAQAFTRKRHPGKTAHTTSNAARGSLAAPPIIPSRAKHRQHSARRTVRIVPATAEYADVNPTSMRKSQALAIPLAFAPDRSTTNTLLTSADIQHNNEPLNDRERRNDRAAEKYPDVDPAAIRWGPARTAPHADLPRPLNEGASEPA